MIEAPTVAQQRPTYQNDGSQTSITINVAPSSRDHTFRRLATMPGVRVVTIEELPPMK
jgi:hypothetical protein